MTIREKKRLKSLRAKRKRGEKWTDEEVNEFLRIGAKDFARRFFSVIKSLAEG